MDPFVGEIRAFGFNFAPTGWALCDGQLISISQNTALFSLLGTSYGGDGRSTFALPNLQGSVPLGMGQGSGLSFRGLGETGGEDSLTLLATEMPAHSHGFKAFVGRGATNANDPATGDALTTSADGLAYVAAAPSGAALDPRTLAASGGGQPHNNLMPYLTLNFCIALQGVYPPRS